MSGPQQDMQSMELLVVVLLTFKIMLQKENASEIMVRKNKSSMQNCLVTMMITFMQKKKGR